MGKILTKSQWEKRKDKGGWSYEKYRNWRVRAEGKKNANSGAGGGGPFNPVPYNTSVARAENLLPYRGGPILSDQQLQGQAGTYVQGMIDPLIAQLTESITKRSKAGSAAIQGYTDAYMGRLGKIGDQTQGAYDQALAQQGSIEGALSSVIRDRSSNALSDLGGTLSSIGAGPSNLGALAQGVAGEQAAYGASGLSNLVSDRASAVSYARQLPGIGALQGAQNLAGFQADLNTKLEEGTGDIRAQIPSLVQNVYQNLLARQMQQQQMRAGVDTGRAGLVDAQQARNLQAALGKAGLEYDYSQLASADNPAVPSGGDTVGNTGLTAQEVAGLRRDAAKNAFSLATQLASAHIDPNLGTAREGQRPAQYNEVQRQVYEYLKAELGNSVDDKTLRLMARNATHAAGLFPRTAQPPQTGSANGGNPAGGKGKGKGNELANNKGASGGSSTVRPPKPSKFPKSQWIENGPNGPGWYMSYPQPRQGVDRLIKVG